MAVPTRRGSTHDIPAVFNCKAMCFVDFFPPVQRCWPLIGAGGQTRNGAPRFRFGRPQQECVARFSISVAPLSLLDESERLTRKTTRLPALDCSTNRRASEVDCYAEYARDYRAEQNKPPDASSADFLRRR